MDTTTKTTDAYIRGLVAGKDASSWIFDGNTTQETYVEFLRLYDECDLPDDFMPPSPLSGEWAGESINELLGDLLTEHGEYNEHICDEYENGFTAGWWLNLTNTANYQVGLVKMMEQDS